MKQFIYIALLLSVFFLSCGDDKQEDIIDIQLQEALNNVGQNLDYYKLPSSTDYNNIPQDPNNPITAEKVELGKLLFHESAFSTVGKLTFTVGEYSCASCHHAGAGFQSGIAQGLGEGGEGFGIMGEGRIKNMMSDPALVDVQPIRTPTILNGAYQPLMLWNGQFGATSLNEGTDAYWTSGTPKETNNLGFEGLEIQAIAGLTEHRIGITKEAVIQNEYQELFDKAFSDVDESERYNLVTAGLAIAAFERVVMSNESPFQQYLQGNSTALTDVQKEGATLFFGKAECFSCHTGPALNKMEFHALGMNEFVEGQVTHYDPENPAQLGRFNFTGLESDKYQFKTPQLYNLKNLNFFGHGASFTSIKEVIEYKNKGVAENDNVPESALSNDFKPLGLTDSEIEKITDFVEHGLYDANLSRYAPSDLPSGNCFPNNDEVSKVDLGCN